MLIRKNTKAFKSIVQVVSECQSRADREKLIRLYITRAGQSIHDRMGIEGSSGEASLFYEMTYQTVLNNLKSANHQLQVSDEVNGLYFFHSSSNKSWDETPFEFDEQVMGVFPSLIEPPVTRKKEKVRSFVLPTPKKPAEKSIKETPSKTPKSTSTKKHVSKAPPQPKYNLTQSLEFTNLDKLVFAAPKATKRDVLDYYYAVADYILPFLKDRPVYISKNRHTGSPVPLTEQILFGDDHEQHLPRWLKTAHVTTGKASIKYLLCNDREHLLFYVEHGCVSFYSLPWRFKNPSLIDYLVIEVDPPGREEAKDVLTSIKEVLDGLKLRSWLKSEGSEICHIHVPLDSKDDASTSTQAAEYICKLIKLKKPGLISVAGSNDNTYGKVAIDFRLTMGEKPALVPYSLASAGPGSVSTPFRWEEIIDDSAANVLSIETALKRIKSEKDPMERMPKQKASASALVSLVKQYYSFLFD